MIHMYTEQLTHEKHRILHIIHTAPIQKSEYNVETYDYKGYPQIGDILAQIVEHMRYYLTIRPLNDFAVCRPTIFTRSNQKCTLSCIGFEKLRIKSL